ncbi:MAG: hypothetical protein OEZ06_18405 [Myxococcales bacterium]|nr:hypothetical protein [Myxococcales bacterium]
MTTEVQRLSQPPQASKDHPPRRLRNFLLEPRFQLKYTSMVVAVTVAVAAVLGFYAYRYSTGQTQLLNIESIEAMQQKGVEPDQEFIEDLQRYAREADRKVMMGIIGGILVLALALGMTGIVVTHRLVGPAYRLRQLITAVGEGKLNVEGGLRKGDELRDVFASFQVMVEHMREAREGDLELVDGLIEEARKREQGEIATQLEQLRERLAAPLS